MAWEPCRSDHSIDRATASITLHKVLDANALDEVAVAGRKVAERHNLLHRVDAVDPIEIPSQPGQAIQLQIGVNAPAPRRVIFQRLDAEGIPVEEMSIGMQRISLQTIRYNRWEDFYGFIKATLSSLNDASPILENSKTVRLEYVDRFQSLTAEADHFEVIERDQGFIVPALRPKALALHCHSGWFDMESANIRRLTNVNIDVADVSIPAPPDPRRKISILTMAQSEALSGTLDEPVGRLDGLHEHLKDIFRNIITSETASRVGIG